MDGHALANPIVTLGIPAAASHAAHHEIYRKLVGEAGWRRLHPAAQRRFSRDATLAGPVTYDGNLSVEMTGLGRLFAWCGLLFGSPLPVHAMADGAAEVRVYSDGADGVVYERHLSSALGREIVCSTKRPWTSERLLECTRRGLSMLLAVFEDNGNLVFESRGFGLLFGHRYLRIPDWLTPGTCRVTHAPIDHVRFRFTLELDHPRWGRLMTQSGIFVDPEA